MMIQLIAGSDDCALAHLDGSSMMTRENLYSEGICCMRVCVCMCARVRACVRVCEVCIIALGTRLIRNLQVCRDIYLIKIDDFANSLILFTFIYESFLFGN